MPSPNTLRIAGAAGLVVLVVAGAALVRADGPAPQGPALDAPAAAAEAPAQTAIAAAAEASPAVAGDVAAAPVVTVYKSPTCGCCTAWVDHMKEAGFKVEVHDIQDVSPVKRDAGVPQALWSCHTAVVNGYTLEGHVPADLVKKLLDEKPRTTAGLAVPGMPMGSPGMEGDRKDPYDVVAFTAQGDTSVYAKR